MHCNIRLKRAEEVLSHHFGPNRKPNLQKRSAMAHPGICSVENCGKPTIPGGMCSMHYQRRRTHGNPLAGRTPNGEAAHFLREIVLAYDGENCLFWPYTRMANGYPQIHLDDRRQLVHRLVCTYRHGPPPTSKHEAAHLCGNGNLACVSWRHLAWKTRAENAADTIRHGRTNRGERSPQSKLTEA